MEPPKEPNGDALTVPENPRTDAPTNHSTLTQNAREVASTSSTEERSPVHDERALTGKITRFMMEQARAHGTIDPSTIENDVGMTEEEARARSDKLDALLTHPLPEEYDYDEIDYADMATVRLLKIWRFEDPAIGVILLKRRSRKDVEGSKERLTMARWWDYLPRTILNTNLNDVEPFDRDLMHAFMEDARERGGRPCVGVDSLREVYHALMFMDKEEVTVRDVVDSDFIYWTTDKRRTQEQRVRRALNLFVRAGAMSKQRNGRAYVYEDTGLNGLSIPQLHIGL